MPDARTPVRARATRSPAAGARRALVAVVLMAAVAVGADQASARQLDPEPAAPSASELEGRRVVLVTGSTSGLGRAVALAMGERGAHVIVHGRNRERGLEVVDEIEAGPGSATFYAADFASLEQVRALGRAILRDFVRVDVLVNNAGIWLSGNDDRYESEDGIELSFQVNYLAGYLLTKMLVPIVPPSSDSRIVNVASGAQTAIDFDDPMIERGYSGGRSYAQSKLAQVMHAMDLAAELAGSGVRVNSLHPASLMDTPMVIDAGVTPRSSVEEGLEAVLNLIVPAELPTGRYFSGTRESRANGQAYDAEARAALRRLSEELLGG